MSVAAYWRATRAYSFPASVVPVLVGTALAARGYGGVRAFDPGTFVVTLVGAILAHFGANVLNDYFDFRYGVDTRPEHGSGVLTAGLIRPRPMLTFGILLMAGAALCGLFLLARHASVVVPLALLGLACAVLYPAFLKRYALGDFLIIVAFGIGLTVGAYGVQVPLMTAGRLGFVVLAALPVSLLVDAILHANNLRDREDDRTARVATLATLLSPAAGRRLQEVLLFGPLGLAVVGVLAGLLPLWSLATLLSLPAILRAYRTGLVPLTAAAHLAFGLLYAASLALRPVFV